MHAKVIKASVHFSIVVILWLYLGWAIIWPRESIDTVESCNLLASQESRVAKLTYSLFTLFVWLHYLHGNFNLLRCRIIYNRLTEIIAKQ